MSSEASVDGESWSAGGIVEEAEESVMHDQFSLLAYLIA